MTVGELREELEAYGDHLPVRVGVAGVTAGLMGLLQADRAAVLAVESVEPSAHDEPNYVLLQVGR